VQEARVQEAGAQEAGVQEAGAQEHSRVRVRGQTERRGALAIFFGNAAIQWGALEEGVQEASEEACLQTFGS
jgi:hypothetical protein